MQISGSAGVATTFKLGRTLTFISWVSKHPVALSRTSIRYVPSVVALYPAVAGSPLTLHTHVPTAGLVWVGQMKGYAGSRTHRDTLSGWLPTEGVGHHVAYAVSDWEQYPRVTLATKGPSPMDATTGRLAPFPPTFQESWSTFPVTLNMATPSSHRGSGLTSPVAMGGSMLYVKDSVFTHPLVLSSATWYRPGPAWPREDVPGGNSHPVTTAPSPRSVPTWPVVCQHNAGGEAVMSATGRGRRST